MYIECFILLQNHLQVQCITTVLQWYFSTSALLTPGGRSVLVMGGGGDYLVLFRMFTSILTSDTPLPSVVNSHTCPQIL